VRVRPLLAGGIGSGPVANALEVVGHGANRTVTQNPKYLEVAAGRLSVGMNQEDEGAARRLGFPVDSRWRFAGRSLNPNSLVTGKNTGIFIVGANSLRLGTGKLF
jgi:hypothetical protein